MTKNLKIGVIGVGVLGSVVKSFFEGQGYKVYCHDKFKKIGSVVQVNKADIVFICVPTPRGKNDECDVSIVDEALSYLKGKKIAVIRSTVIPFTTDRLQMKYPAHQLLFVPEFLTERRAGEDFRNPKLQIVGYTPKSAPAAYRILKILPKAKFSKIMPAAEAEMLKYVRNSYLATKNIFFNQVYDLCRRHHLEYLLIKDCAEADPWIGPEHLDVWLDGFRGFNGKCLPKDTEALLAFAKRSDVNLTVLKSAIDFNSALLASKGIKKDS